MIDKLIPIFTPLLKLSELFIKKTELKKQERLQLLEALSIASMETKKAFIQIKRNHTVPVEKQYEIAELWRKAFVIISDKHPEEAYLLMGKSDSWLTPEFWKNNEEEMKKIEANLNTVDELITTIR
ncbi:hypothetical protein [Ascidiimonas sp. W6]|uniref:hypothetical protein n=1 Tax=Ascidiimonas meishanensis TaxID=3128903 RepID=UPI0030ED7F1F